MNVRLTLTAAVMLFAACAPTNDTPFAPDATPPPQLGPPPVGSNAPPSVTITSPSDGAVVPLGSAGGATVTITADFTDPDAADTHSCSIDWQLALTIGTVTESAGAGSCAGSFTFPSAGSYTINVSVIDNLGGTATEAIDITVVPTVSAPTLRRLSGEGLIRAVRGTFPNRPRAAGEIGFGVSVRPAARGDGLRSHVRIDLKRLNHKLRANRLTSFTITGAQAELRGVASRNGRGKYPFMISVVDGHQSGGDGIDRIRIMVWGERGLLVDTEPNATTVAAVPTMALARGRIVLSP